MAASVAQLKQETMMGLEPPPTTSQQNASRTICNSTTASTNNNNNNNNNSTTNSNNNSQQQSVNKRKSKHDRNSRKRSKSFSGSGLTKMMSMKPVLPTKFLLGGNINDPLNLNSLQDEEINRAMNAVTPKSSPIPTPPRRKGQIEVIIPKNKNDPLNLIDCADDAEYEQQLYSPIKKGRKKRLKKKRTISATEIQNSNNSDIEQIQNSEAKTPETSTDSAKIPPELSNNDDVKSNHDLTLELSPKKDKTIKRKVEEQQHVNNKKFKFNSMDKIVSPVVPQPGAWLKRTNSVIKRQKPRQNKRENETLPQFKEKNKKFQYGNYNRYYGYRNINNEVDPRLRLFHQHRYLFEGKEILDIGCNIGHITLSVARDFGAKNVVGIDIDPKLISIARKNIKHYVKNSDTPKPNDDIDELNNKKSSEFFPISMPILYGSIDIPGFNDTHSGRGFPNNVTFKQCNYILEDDNLLALEQPQFDVILCLSTTKWIHLNWGDAGLKQVFRRIYAQLRPGGRLILEAQKWDSYKSKRKLTETTYKNYNSIEFFPEKFTEYLLSSVVGFAKSEVLGHPFHNSTGFRRPIQIFTKSTMYPSERVEVTTPNNNLTTATTTTTITTTPTTRCSGDSLFKSIKTEKYESQTQLKVENVEHIYTNILNRYCGYEDSFDGNCELSNEASATSATTTSGSGGSGGVVKNNGAVLDEQHCDSSNGGNT